MKKKVPIGEIAATIPALMALFDADETTDVLFERHACGDWGDGDAATNELALITGGRLISKYRTLRNVELWVVTAAEINGKRKMTMCMLAEEFEECNL